MLKMPPINDPRREYYTNLDLTNYRELPTLRQGLNACRNTVKQSGVNAAFSVVLRADGKIHLIRVGKRGGWRVLWNFGKAY